MIKGLKDSPSVGSKKILKSDDALPLDIITMPPNSVIDAKFESLKDELGLPPGITLEPSKKWALIMQYMNIHSTVGNVEEVTKNEVAKMVKKLKKNRKEMKLNDLITIRTLLISRPTSWVKAFMDSGGVHLLFDLIRETLHQKKIESRDIDIIAECVRSLKAIMNTDSVSFDTVVDTADSTELMVKAVPYLNILTKALIFELLAVVCFKRGSKRVFKEFCKIGFKWISEGIGSKSHEFKISTLVLVNGLICGTDDYQLQSKITLELENAGFYDEFDAIRGFWRDDQHWRAQVEIFEEFENDLADSMEGQIAKLQSKIKELERVISDLQRRNAILAEEKEELKLMKGTEEGASPLNYQTLLRNKDELIVVLEWKINSLLAGVPAKDLGLKKPQKVTPPPPPQVFSTYLEDVGDGPPEDLPPHPLDLYVYANTIKSDVKLPSRPETIAAQILPNLLPTHRPTTDIVSPHVVSPETPTTDPASPPVDVPSLPPDSPSPPVDVPVAPADVPLPSTDAPPPACVVSPPEASPIEGPSPSLVPGPPPVATPSFLAPRITPNMISTSASAPEFSVPPPSIPAPPPPMTRGPPPPPGSAPPPPSSPSPPGAPPPPMGPEKPKIVPNKKMKGVMWTKLQQRSIKNTVWDNLNDEKVAINIPEIEELFGIDPLSKKVIEKTPKKAASTTVSLLEPKRSNNIEIMLRGFKMSHIEIKDAIKEMKEDILSLELLKSVLLYIPNSEEMNLIENYEGNKADLGNAEKYFIAVAQVPLLPMRVTAMEYKKSFETSYNEIKRSIDVLLSAITLIKTDSRFHKTLEIIMAFGNYMNGSTNRGAASGFKLNVIRKLGDVKSYGDRGTLLDYLAEYLEKNNKNLLGFLTDFEIVSDATKENLQEVVAELSKLAHGLEPIQTHLESVSCDAYFKKTMARFAKESQGKLEQLQQTAVLVQESYKNILNFYCEAPNTTGDEFFGQIADFVNSLKKSIKDNKQRKEEALKAAAREAAAAERAEKMLERKEHEKLKPETPGKEDHQGKLFHHTEMKHSPNHTPNVETGELDKIINAMKNGKMFNERKVNKLASNESDFGKRQMTGRRKEQESARKTEKEATPWKKVEPEAKKEVEAQEVHEQLASLITKSNEIETKEFGNEISESDKKDKRKDRLSRRKSEKLVKKKEIKDKKEKEKIEKLERKEMEKIEKIEKEKEKEKKDKVKLDKHKNKKLETPNKKELGVSFEHSENHLHQTESEKDKSEPEPET